MRSSSRPSPVPNISYCFEYIFQHRPNRGPAGLGACLAKPGTLTAPRLPIRVDFVRIRHHLLRNAFGGADGSSRMKPTPWPGRVFRPRGRYRPDRDARAIIAWRVDPDKTISSAFEDRDRSGVPFSRPLWQRVGNSRAAKCPRLDAISAPETVPDFPFGSVTIVDLQSFSVHSAPRLDQDADGAESESVSQPSPSRTGAIDAGHAHAGPARRSIRPSSHAAARHRQGSTE